MPAKCVKPHAMVRDDQLAYAQIAKRLGVSERCVHEYAMTVHRTFRKALPSVGIEAPNQPRRGRPKAATEALEPIAGMSMSSAGRRTATRGERVSSRGVHALTRDHFESICRDFEPTVDEFESTRGEFELTRGEFESTRG